MHDFGLCFFNTQRFRYLSGTKQDFACNQIYRWGGGWGAQHSDGMKTGGAWVEDISNHKQIVQ